MPGNRALEMLSRRSWLPTLLTLCVASVYGYFLYRHAINIPQGDDITDVLKVITTAANSEQVGDFFAALFAQHNDHRTLSSRLVYWFSYSVQGEIDFRVLTWLASAALALLLVCLAVAAGRVNYRAWILLSAALLLLHLRAYDLVLWAMAGFAYYFVFAYGFACICCLYRVNRTRLVLGMAFAFLATYSLASGQLIWFIGLVLLIQQRAMTGRVPSGYIVSWCVAALATLWLWRFELDTPNSINQLLQLLFDTPLHHAQYFLALLGSAMSDSSVIAAAMSGAGMLLVLLLVSIRRMSQEDLRLELMCWYVVFSVLVVTLGRAPYTNLEYALASRYAFPSVLMLASLWTLAATRFVYKRPMMLGLGVILALAYCITSYMHFAEPLQKYTEKRVQRFNRGHYWIFGTPAQVSNGIVADAIEAGVYEPPARPHPRPGIAVTSRKNKKSAR